jgi:tetratricopeptide (TPR) repeat protein
MHHLRLGLFLLAVCTATLAAPDVYEHEGFGFRVALGNEWSVTGDAGGGTALHLTIAGQGDMQRCQLQIRVNPPGTRPEPEAMRAATVATIDATPGYDNTQLVRRKVAGREAKGLICDTSAAGFPGIMRQAYLAENGWLYVLQDFYPADAGQRVTTALDELWESFAFIPLESSALEQHKLQQLAALCGSEIDWADDWAQAAERAAKQKRPVLVHARMYRGFSITDDTLSGPFMNRNVITLVNERCVPLAVTETSGLPFADPSAYGLGPMTFGSACLLVSPAGDVLWDGRSPADLLLRQALSDMQELPGSPVDASADPFARAQAHARRGELALAQDLLASPTTAAEHRLLADMHRRDMHADLAFAALDAAEDASGGVELAHDLDADRVKLLLATGQTDAADTLARQLLSRSPQHERVPELLHVRARVALAREDRDRAQALLERVIEQHEDSRWAWAAAATLTSTAWAMESSGSSTWPDRELLAQLATPRFEPVPAGAWRSAERDALSWMLAEQRDDGSWALPSSLAQQPGDPPHDFDLAAAALAVSALLPHRDDPAVRDAIDAAVAWLVVAYPAERDAEPEPAFMDYAVWSRACILLTLSDLVGTGVGSRRKLRGMAKSLFVELSDLSKPGGGWSYYLTGDVTAASPTALQSMSFTNALIVLSLLRADEVELIDASDLVESGVASLERGRLANGNFLYMVQPPGQPAAASLGSAGSAGRGPVCTLAMAEAGELSLDAVRVALDRFIEHRDSYTRERGKHLMHAGTQGQGSHYLMFDYATAAWAVQTLPAEERSRYVEPLLEMLLTSRTVDGKFVDNPIIGAATSTSLALSAFEALRSGALELEP